MKLALNCTFRKISNNVEEKTDVKATADTTSGFNGHVSNDTSMTDAAVDSQSAVQWVHQGNVVLSLACT